MRQMQVEIDEDDASRLEVCSRERGIPVDELIRWAVSIWLGPRQGLSREEIKRRALSVIGLGFPSSGLDDISVEHDRYLDEAYGSWQSSPTPQDSSHSLPAATATTEGRKQRGKGPSPATSV